MIVIETRPRGGRPGPCDGDPRRRLGLARPTGCREPGVGVGAKRLLPDRWRRRSAADRAERADRGRAGRCDRAPGAPPSYRPPLAAATTALTTASASSAISFSRDGSCRMPGFNAGRIAATAGIRSTPSPRAGRRSAHHGHRHIIFNHGGGDSALKVGTGGHERARHRLGSGLRIIVPSSVFPQGDL
jgi:hypothetical protein